ncbi:MAG: M14 family zinc carboxypeptidase [Nocardioides sp.]
MQRRSLAFLVVLFLLGALGAPLSSQAEPGRAADPGDGRGLEVYVGQVDPADIEKLKLAGLDHEDVATGKAPGGKVAVEVVMNAQQASKLAAEGVQLSVKKVNGKAASRVALAQNRSGYQGFRSWSEAGGIADELRETAAANPDLAKLVPFGTTVRGQEMLAVKVTNDANQIADGSRPAVMYLGAQHAREWITPEMVRRLMHHFIDNYGTDDQITRLVDTTELWFVPVANPDGYDYTFTGDNRLWRKNLQDNDGDGFTTGNDGVDLNRNYATKWGWDNEGSSPQPSSQTFRGSGPNSEPESQGLNSLFARVGFEHFVNYHSAAELLLYGIGWQVNTPSPDDTIQVPMVGTDEDPAVPGYDPDISAELYTTNGDTDSHMTVKFGTLGFTPEMTTCEVASNKYDDDPWVADDCVSGFNFPDDDRLITEEFEKNIPFALSVAESAHDPADPVTFNGDEAPDLVADPFAVSHGTTQPVAVTADREVANLEMRFAINGGRTRSTGVSEWEGGERYGDTNDDYYGEFRGTVTRATSGDSVRVWFTGTKDGDTVSTQPFTYRVASDIGGDVLVLAAEDYSGVSPAQKKKKPVYADEHVEAVEAAGYDADVYDVDANNRTAPHHLGVLSHYDAVVWESGDDVIPRSPGQPAGTIDDNSLAIELAVRDYLNEGGKLLVAGKNNRLAEGADGVYDYNPYAPPECTTVDTYPCLPVFNDFLQYWLGSYTYVDDGGTDAAGNPYPLEGTDGAFAGFAGDLNAPGSARNQDHTASFLVTSSFLPPSEFPQFASSAAADWVRPGGAPYDPHTGDWYAYSQQDDVSYKRLTRTVDLTGASAGALDFWTSYDLEADWDYAFVEARPVGTEEWTTLPDANGHTQQGTGESCPEGWHELHPFLEHYQGADCSPTGSTGEWHAASGNSNGWQQWSIDLSQYAGQQVEVSIAYASDWGTQGLGAFVDDATVLVDAAEQSTTSFETDLGGWTVSGAPPGSEPNNNDWQRDQLAFEEGSVVVTDDTVFAGFGAEGLAPAQRNDFVARSLQHLLD